MKPTTTIASVRTPGGSDMVLYQHDQSFFIRVDGEMLMHSRQHESEVRLARLGCSHLTDEDYSSVLVGGLGLGYTLRGCLDVVGRGATVTVCELMDAVIDWNRRHLGVLNAHPLDDPRVEVRQEDVVRHLAAHPGAYDAILLDVDNGPSAMSDAGNQRLYGSHGIRQCARALKDGGRLAVWSAEPSKPYEQALMRAGLAVRRYRVPAYKESKSQSRFVWLAAEDASGFPPGGGAPNPPPPKRRRSDRHISHPSRGRRSQPLRGARSGKPRRASARPDG